MAQQNNPYYVDPLGGNVDFMGGLSGIGKAMQNREQLDAQAQQREFNNQLATNQESRAQGQFDAQQGQFEQEQAQAVKSRANQETIKKLYKIKGMPEGEQMAALTEAIQNPNDDFDESDLPYALDDKALYAAAVQNFGADEAKAMYGGGARESGKVGTVSPKDFTVESIGEYEQTGNIQDLSRYSPKTVNVAGVEHQLNPETQKWEPIIDATSNNLNNQAVAIANIEADKKSRLDFATSKTKWQTGRPKFNSKINSSKASQKILMSTSEQLKKNINNWSTKYGASLSSLPGSEARRLKNQLNTLKAHSAFSTLTDLKDSGGTLGAISEAELVLLEAKLGALDQGGDATELIRVIEQIVNSNASSIGRLETEFYNTDAMYKGGFDDIDSPQADITTYSDEDLFN